MKTECPFPPVIYQLGIQLTDTGLCHMQFLSVYIVMGAQWAVCRLLAICSYYEAIKGNLHGDTHTVIHTEVQK